LPRILIFFFSILFTGNFTFYSKAVVTNPRNVIIARNIFCNQYIRGNCTKFLGSRSEKDDMRRRGVGAYSPLDGKHTGSIISVIVPSRDTNHLPNPIDMTGSFNGYEDPNQSQAHYSMAGAVNHLYKLEEHQKDLHSDGDLFLTRVRNMNTVCFRGHQFSYDLNTKRHSAITVNTGHWGPNVPVLALLFSPFFYVSPALLSFLHLHFIWMTGILVVGA